MSEHIKMPVIIGDRLLLRPMAESDADLIVKWRNDPEIMKWMFSQDVITISSHLQWFRARGDTRVDYVICLREDRSAIGTIHYLNIDRAACKAETGKMIGERSLWGKGYATEAYGMWLHFGFHHLGLECVYGRTLSTNLANISANKRLGLEVCSIEQDVQIGHRKGVDVVTTQITKAQALAKHVLPTDLHYDFE